MTEWTTEEIDRLMLIVSAVFVLLVHAVALVVLISPRRRP